MRHLPLIFATFDADATRRYAAFSADAMSRLSPASLPAIVHRCRYAAFMPLRQLLTFRHDTPPLFLSRPRCLGFRIRSTFETLSQKAHHAVFIFMLRRHLPTSLMRDIAVAAFAECASSQNRLFIISAMPPPSARPFRY